MRNLLRSRKFIIMVCAIFIVCAVGTALIVMQKKGEAKSETKDNIMHMQVSSEGSWVYDPYDERVVEDRVGIIAKIRYAGEKHSLISGNSDSPQTDYTVEILEVYKGSLKKKQIKVRAGGGTVSMKEWKDNLEPESYEQNEYLKTASDRELEQSTLTSKTLGIDLEKGDVAVAFISYSKDYNLYYIAGNGMCLFEQTSEGIFENKENEGFIVDEKLIAEIKERNKDTLDKPIKTSEDAKREDVKRMEEANRDA